ncbi:MAG TPA: ABC transporter ATP-binding protein [Candidatus Bathyarchaeia archaeon]|nr:ABC transporter ATP-binding protein [Candidatus Bathyarchaeia archaeon]
MINLDKVAKRFGSTLAVDRVSLKIQEGEIVGFLGPNGAGKTTTIKLIAGILPPSQGQVLIDNLNYENSGSEIRKKIGYLPENNPLYEELTVEEYLKLWLSVKALESVEEKEALRFVVRNANLAEVYYRPISQLSKGFRQRVGLAQAILAQPEILLLDEPTEGLDPNQRREIHQLIKGLGKNRTVIICSHVLPEVVKMCNRVIVIHQGKIVADDTPENLGRLRGGKQYFEVEVSGPKINRQLFKELSYVVGVEEIKKKDVKGKYFVIETGTESDIRPAIISLVKKYDWQLWTLFRRQLDLEDIFAQLTKD